MAQTPDINETFLREVDENLRRDQARDFVRKNGTWLIAAVVLFLVGSGGAIWWQQHSRERSEQQVEKLVDIYRAAGKGKIGAATAAQIDELSQSGSKAIRASALFTRAVTALEDNNIKLATAKFREIAQDKGLPSPYRDLALIRQTALEFDQISPQEVISRLEPLAKPGEPWFGTAGEMTGMALVKQGRKAEAGQMFAAIAKDKNAPDSTRQRAIQMASSLGVDASSALPPAQ